MEHEPHHNHGQTASKDQIRKKDEHAPDMKDMDDNPPMGHAGHDHHVMMTDDFKKRFYFVLILTIPIILLSPMIQHWLNVHWEFTGSQYILFVLSSVVFFYGGWPFLKGWFDEMKIWKPGIMTLIGFAITVAYVYNRMLCACALSVDTANRKPLRMINVCNDFE